MHEYGTHNYWVWSQQPQLLDTQRKSPRDAERATNLECCPTFPYETAYTQSIELYVFVELIWCFSFLLLLALVSFAPFFGTLEQRTTDPHKGSPAGGRLGDSRIPLENSH
jgi:hypothetical protein